MAHSVELRRSAAREKGVCEVEKDDHAVSLSKKTDSKDDGGGVLSIGAGRERTTVSPFLRKG
jgi:hypothetical protein